MSATLRKMVRFVCTACDMELHDLCMGHCVCSCQSGTTTYRP